MVNPSDQYFSPERDGLICPVCNGYLAEVDIDVLYFGNEHDTEPAFWCFSCESTFKPGDPILPVYAYFADFSGV